MRESDAAPLAPSASDSDHDLIRCGRAKVVGDRQPEPAHDWRKSRWCRRLEIGHGNIGIAQRHPGTRYLLPAIADDRAIGVGGRSAVQKYSRPSTHRSIRTRIAAWGLVR